jgi:hypothetical protein
MKNMHLSAQIEAAFPASVGVLSDQFIEEHPDLCRLDASVDLQTAVPAYMAWCARNGHRPAELVHDYTVDALAVFGRSKKPEFAPLNFKFTCSTEQRQVVEKFLRWCLDPALLLDTKQVERSLKRWSAG